MKRSLCRALPLFVLLLLLTACAGQQVREAQLSVLRDTWTRIAPQAQAGGATAGEVASMTASLVNGGKQEVLGSWLVVEPKVEQGIDNLSGSGNISDGLKDAYQERARLFGDGVRVYAGVAR